MKNTYELEEAIMSYNYMSKYMNFDALHHLFNNEYSADESKKFFKDTFPRIVASALSISDVFPHSIPLLKQQQAQSVTLSKLQVACLLCKFLKIITLIALFQIYFYS